MMCLENTTYCICCKDSSYHTMRHTSKTSVTNICQSCGGIHHGTVTWAVNYDCSETRDRSREFPLFTCPFCTGEMEMEEPVDFHHWYCPRCDKHLTIRPGNDGRMAGGNR